MLRNRWKGVRMGFSPRKDLLRWLPHKLGNRHTYVIDVTDVTDVTDTDPQSVRTCREPGCGAGDGCFEQIGIGCISARVARSLRHEPVRLDSVLGSQWDFLPPLPRPNVP